MPLSPQLYQLVFDQGIDTKSDPKLLVGKLLVLENGRFRSRGRIKKRWGYESLSRDVMGSTTGITVGQGITAFQDELCLFDDDTLYTRNEANENWINKGTFTSINVTQRTVTRNTYEQTAQDSAVHSLGLWCFVWEDTQTSGVRYSILDSTTGAYIVNNAEVVGSTGTRPKVVAHGNNFLIFYADTAATTLYYKAIGITTPTTLGSAVSVTNNMRNTARYDVAVIGQRVFVFWHANAAAEVHLKYYNQALSASAAVTIAAHATCACLTVFEDSLENRVNIVWDHNGTLRFRTYNYDTTIVVKTNTDLEVIASLYSVTGVSTPGSSSVFRVIYTTTAASTYNYLTRSVTVTGYTAGSPGSFLRSVALAGKAFNYNSVGYVPLVHESSLQTTYFIANQSGELVAKAFHGVGGGIPTRSQLANTNALSSTQFQMAVLTKGELKSDGGNIFTLRGVSSLSLDFFDTAKSYLRAEIAKNLHIGGGFLQMYDGARAVEHGFHLFPENATAAVTVPNTGTTNSYQYAICYEWIDNQGQKHRSSPSVPLTQTTVNAISNSSADTRVTLTIPTLRLTAKHNSSPVDIVVYRTENNGQTFYRTSSLSSPTRNSLTADTVSFVDSTTDARLIGNDPLYTLGGVVENYPSPPTSSLAVHNNRLFALDSTNPKTVWYSKEITEGAPAEFSDLFTLTADPRGGDVTAIASLDDKFILFKESSIFFVAGRGPVATGDQNDFSPAIDIKTDCGCTNPRSIVNVPAGIMYQSEKGIYLLDRGLRVSYIGDRVEEYNDETVTSAELIPDTNEVRFTLDSGQVLVYDYEADQWGVDTNLDAVDSCVWNGRFAYLQGDGTVRRETPGEFSDAGNYIKVKLRTAWLQFGGLQGFQRIWRFLILGEYISAHKLLVKLAYDFDPTPVQEEEIDVDTLIDLSVYGEDSPYGSGPYGGEYPTYQWEIQATRQKCSAVQITLEDAQSGTTIAEGLSLSGITLKVGLIPGLKKVKAARSI